MSKQAEVGDDIWIKTFILLDPDGDPVGWFWVQVPGPDTSEEQVLANQQAWHGPFESEDEAQADLELELFGPECEIIDGGTWDPGWERVQ